MLRRRPIVPLALVLLSSIGRPAGAQQRRSHLGLAGSGAVESYAGVQRLERGLTAAEIGASLDLGWIGAPRVRLVGDVSLIGLRRSEIDPTDTTRYSSLIYDLSANVGAVALGGTATSRLVPYATFAVGVHALASAYQRVSLDQRYNGNRFGISGGVGLRSWLSSSGRGGAFLEGRRTYVHNMNRWGARLGATMYFGEMTRPSH